ncbi:hypothetical protein UCREL1_6368 [Eutypa lata UCREL1]|uniref:Myb-like domain-containing protein n=1 Tax=Eutypa lata (strain UCR-EL1) TaxID=1287681 RepID=M7SR08_EUTLA|nr:hypothetical protein UCREL1_6368 [Eutypa lata UCREL1]
MNKNWNDRADKDLFFTILSVKNIGVISGAEWTTIGNHMRSMGYNFTNEGCRQHFQGLRRAQHKTEPNGSASESPRKADPTANPITRRPGPGRGRPRKQPIAPIFGSNQSPIVPTVPATSAAPVTTATAVSGVTGTTAPPQDVQPSIAGLAVGMPMPVPIPTTTSATAEVQETNSLDLMQEEEELDEHPAKRQRLDDSDKSQSNDDATNDQSPNDEAPGDDAPNDNDEAPNDEEAVLALAADGLPDSDEHYGAPE